MPEGPGGDKTNEVGNEMLCERCKGMYVVSRTPRLEDCVYHWARPFRRKIDGKYRFLVVTYNAVDIFLVGASEVVYRCCSLLVAEPGCQRGVHVFYEKSAEALHSRHPFSSTSPPTDMSTSLASEKLGVAALDCEMLYTTGGMRVGRVSVVDGLGRKVYDELVKMDDDVDVMFVLSHLSANLMLQLNIVSFISDLNTRYATRHAQ